MPVVNYDDARTMFVGSLVEKDEVPYAVLGASPDGSLTCFNLRTSREELLPADPLVVTAPIANQIGYYQSQRGARFLKRLPRRAYKVGIDGRNTQNMVDVESFVHSPGLLKLFLSMFDKNYPTLEKALASATFNEERGKSIAFDRQWAVLSGGHILYRGDHTGFLIREGGEIQGQGSAYLLRELMVLKGL